MTIAEKGKSRIRTIVRACQVITRMGQGNSDTPGSDVLYYKMLAEYYNRLLKAEAEGKFIAAHTVFFPSEIIYAMDLVPMHTEATTWMLSLFTGDCTDLLSEAAALGMVAEICTPHRGITGAYSLGALPRPSAMLWSNMVCDNTAKSGELIMELNKCPGFFIDHPFKDSEAEKKYLVSELRDMVTFLEEQSGHKMNWDKLSEIVARMDYQIQLIREINEMRKNIPSPFHTQGFLQLLSADYLFPGQPEAIEYLETLRDECKEMVKHKRGAVSPERFRLMWLFLPPMYMIGYLEQLSKEFGAVSVVEPFFTLWGEGRLDPSKPLESVAQKSYMIPEMRMYGPLDNRALGAIVDSAKQFKVDGAVYFADVGCRHSCATIKLFKDTLNKIDIPVLTLDCDVVDPTATSKEEVREKLERFFELLEDR